MNALEEEVPADGQTKEDQQGHRQEAEFFETLIALSEGEVEDHLFRAVAFRQQQAPISAWASQ